MESCTRFSCATRRCACVYSLLLGLLLSVSRAFALPVPRLYTTTCILSSIHPIRYVKHFEHDKVVIKPRPRISTARYGPSPRILRPALLPARAREGLIASLCRSRPRSSIGTLTREVGPAHAELALGPAEDIRLLALVQRKERAEMKHPRRVLLEQHHPHILPVVRGAGPRAMPTEPSEERRVR